MNKNFLEHYMKTKPETLEQKYLFLVDSQELAFAVIAAGYQAIALLNDKDGFYNTDTFIAYMRGIVCAGTYQTDYCYVPACSTKKINDTLECFFQENYLTCQKGWMLFKDKDYLEKLEYTDELKNVLHNFILRFEGSREEKLNLDRFHKFNEKGKRIGVFDLEIVDYLLQTVPFFVVKEVPYVYEQGCYHADPSGIRLKAHIQKLMYRDVVKSATIQSVYQLLLSQEGIQKSFSDLNNQPSHWVNFLNGYFDVIEWKMIPHNTKYLMINQIPYEFHPEDDEQILQGGNHIQNFLEFSIPNQLDQQMYWQYLGYCMTTDTQFQKFLMIKGAGGTGKSVLISFTQKLIGTENYCSLSLQDLNQRFYPTALFGKTLNACADIPSEALKQVAIVKKAVGEDMLLYEKKNKDPEMFFSYAKLLFSANEMPLNLDEKSNAYYRRLLILEMNQIVPKDRKDSKLLDKLLEEANYAIHKAMHSLRQLYLEQEFTESPHSKECIEILYRAADSVKAFTDETLCHKKGEKLKRSEVYKRYEEYCIENGRTAHKKSKFWEYMADKKYLIKRCSDGAFYFIDTAFQETDFVEVDDCMEIPFEQTQLPFYDNNDKNDNL